MGTLCILGLISLRHREQIENKLQEALDSWKAEKWAPPTNRSSVHIRSKWWHSRSSMLGARSTQHGLVGLLPKKPRHLHSAKDISTQSVPSLSNQVTGQVANRELAPRLVLSFTSGPLAVGMGLKSQRENRTMLLPFEGQRCRGKTRIKTARANAAASARVYSKLVAGPSSPPQTGESGSVLNWR